MSHRWTCAPASSWPPNGSTPAACANNLIKRHTNCSADPGRQSNLQVKPVATPLVGVPSSSPIRRGKVARDTHKGCRYWLLFSSSRDFLPGSPKAEFLDGRTQPANRRAIVDFLARFYQERGRLRSRRQLVGFAQRGEFRVVLEGPVHIDTARLTIFDIVFVFSSTLWTNCHSNCPLCS